MRKAQYYCLEHKNEAATDQAVRMDEVMIASNYHRRGVKWLICFCGVLLLRVYFLYLRRFFLDHIGFEWLVTFPHSLIAVHTVLNPKIARACRTHHDGMAERQQKI